MMRVSKILFVSLLLLIVFRSNTSAQKNVDLATGRVNLMIPIYNYSNSSQRLSLNVNLQYNSGGIKVNDIASKVGTGWTLNAGGFIRRRMMGGLDDKYPEGTMYQNGVDYDDLDAFIPLGSPPQVNNTYKDNELDVYEFNFNGQHGTFSIGRNKEVIQHVDSKMKIDFEEEDMTSADIITRISKFTITAINGIKYIFDKKETCMKLYLFFSDYNDGNSSSILTSDTRYFPKGGMRFVSAWYLSEIKNPLTGFSINFQYTNVDAYKVIDKTASDTDIDTENDGPNHTESTVIDYINSPRLKKIVLTSKKSLIFNYEDKARLDYGTDIYDYGLHDNALSSIFIEDNNKVIKKFNFSYDYLYKNEELNYTEANALQHSDIHNSNINKERFYLRLALKELQVEQYGKELPPYKFSYRHYGGTSGPVNTKDIVPPRVTSKKNGFGFYFDGDYHKLGNGMLEEIQYPTGGYTKFFYMDNHKVMSPVMHLESNGVSVYKTITYDGINHDNDLTTEYKYVLHDKDGNALTTSIYGNFPTTSVIHKSAFVETIGSPSVDQIFLVIGYIYGGKNFVNGTIVSIVHEIVTLFIGSSFKTINFDVHMEGGSFNSKLPVRYSEVAVLHKSGQKTLGKTIYTFTSFDDIPPLFSNQSPPYSQKQIAPSWCYGHPKCIKTYNREGELISEKKYTYNFVYRVLDYASWYESLKIVPFRILCVKNSHFDTYKSHIAWNTDEYYPITGHIEIKSIDDRSYSQDRSYLEKLTRFQYDPNTYLLKKKITTNSTGESIEKRIFYPADYSLTGSIQLMKDNNMIAAPVETETLIYKGTEAPEIISGSITDYDVIANGDIKPVKIYRLKSAIPVSESTLGLFDPSKINQNPTYFKEEGLLAYNQNGTVIQSYSRGRTVSRIYGYEHQYPTAVIKNASNDEVAYTSFETDEKGNWQYSGIPLLVRPSVPLAVTGNKYYNLSKGSLTKSIQGLTNGKKYKLSYWTKNNTGFNLNYSSTVTKGATTEGWTYFQHVFTAGAADIILSGSGPIDEVRLYPLDASMVTSLYIPLIGKSATCNANNQLQYYKYDELGRLLFILDENRNIIQKRTYHYRGQPAGDAIYYNPEMSQTFTKNDCQTGYNGSSVTYTVPANKYLSTVSPEYAEAQAQTDLNTNGQDYANIHGSCTLGNAIAVIGSEYLGTAYSITFTKSNDPNESYTLTLGPNYENHNLGTIPLGTYNIKVCPIYNTGNSYNFQINSVYTGGVGCHNYTNMNLSTPGNITVIDF